MSHPPHFVSEPLQQRSRETLERIVAATRELLAEAVLEEITVQQIVRRAGCSVGTFYQRFAGKDAVLPHLLEIHYAEVRERVAGMVATTTDLGLVERVGEVVHLLATVAVEERGLIRTLVLRNQQRPESIPPQIRDAAREILGTIYGHLLACRGEMRHREPRRALEVGLLMVAATIRERLILVGATQAATLELDAAELARELTAALIAYLENPVDVPPRSIP